MGAYQLLHNGRLFWANDGQLVYVSSVTGDSKPELGEEQVWTMCVCYVVRMYFSRNKYFSCTYTAVVRGSNPSIWKIETPLNWVLHCKRQRNYNGPGGGGAGGAVYETQLKREKIFRNNDMKQIISSSISTCLFLWHLSDFLHTNTNWVVILHWISYCNAVFCLT
jgi:hypothetical protein